MQCFLNIKISQTATASEPTANTLLIKTQCNRIRKNHGQQHYEIIYYKHEKETFYIFGKHETHKKILNSDYI